MINYTGEMLNLGYLKIWDSFTPPRVPSMPNPVHSLRQRVRGFTWKMRRTYTPSFQTVTVPLDPAALSIAPKIKKP